MRALLAWELGDNFGHMDKLIHVGEALQRRGCDVTLALQNPAAAGPMIGNTTLRIVAAPYGLVRPKPRAGSSASVEQAQVLTFADDIRNCGYENEQELAALIRAWEGLFTTLKPDVLLVNSAPTALLAAQNFPFKKINAGIGYEIPPLTNPMPPMIFWEKADMEEIAKREWRVLSVINAAQRLLKRPMFKTLADCFVNDAEFLTTFPELDHYANKRKKAHYVGPFFTTGKGQPVFWPDGPRNKRIFAYLYPNRPIFASAFQALKRLPHDVVLVAPKMPSKHIKQNETERFRIYDVPICLDHLTNDCDLAVTHGGGTTLAQFLLKGAPQLVLPNHIEQMMTAKRVEIAGLGLIAHLQMTPDQIENRISSLLNDPKFKEQAKSFGAKIKSFDPSRQADMLARLVTDIVQKPVNAA